MLRMQEMEKKLEYTHPWHKHLCVCKCHQQNSRRDGLWRRKYCHHPPGSTKWLACCLEVEMENGVRDNMVPVINYKPTQSLYPTKNTSIPQHKTYHKVAPLLTYNPVVIVVEVHGTLQIIQLLLVLCVTYLVWLGANLDAVLIFHEFNLKCQMKLWVKRTIDSITITYLEQFTLYQNHNFDDNSLSMGRAGCALQRLLGPGSPLLYQDFQLLDRNQSCWVKWYCGELLNFLHDIATV